MSIYGTILSLDDDHEPDCEIWAEVDGIFEPAGECSCQLPWWPLVYEGSHVLPSDEDSPRGGWVEMACIPDHVHRDGRDDAVAREGRKPWLRLSVGEDGGGDATVLVTEAQARRMWQALGEWLGVPGLSLEEVGWLLRRASRWHPADPMAESIRSKLAALADAMERYEGEGGGRV